MSAAGGAQQVGGGLGQLEAGAAGLGLGHQVAQLRRGGEGGVLAVPAGEGEPQATGGRAGGGQQLAEPALESLGAVDGLAQLGSGLDEAVQGDDEGRGPGLGVLDVDPYGDGLLDGPGDLAGGGQGLVGGLRAHAGDLPQLVPARRVHVPHGTEAGRLHGREPQPPLGGVLQPGDRDGLELLGDQFVPEGGEGGPYGVEGARVVVENGTGGVVQPRSPLAHLPRPPTHGRHPHLPDTRHATPHTPPLPVRTSSHRGLTAGVESSVGESRRSGGVQSVKAVAWMEFSR